jgi:hypothetical protein
MSCEIIQFSAAARLARPVSGKQTTAGVTAIGNRALTPRQRRREGKPELPPPATETAKNFRIRTERRDAWWHAGRVTEYWRTRVDWHSALGTAQQYGIADGASFPSAENESRLGLVDAWREAVVKQLLTPAPDGAAVAWKRAQLAGREFKQLPAKAERIERMIADDVAFLAAHPTRRSNSEAIARNREFKEAMRQRIRDVAASRDLSPEEFKPVLRLKHQEIGEFTEKHGVNLEWLLEGRGRVFKNNPIRLVPNSTGAEFAAVVATLPEAKQQMIEAAVDRLLKERDQ